MLQTSNPMLRNSRHVSHSAKAPNQQIEYSRPVVGVSPSLDVLQFRQIFLTSLLLIHPFHVLLLTAHQLLVRDLLLLLHSHWSLVVDVDFAVLIFVRRIWGRTGRS